MKEWLDLFIDRILPWLCRLFIDYRYWVFVSLSFILLFASVRYYLGDKKSSAVIFSVQFLVPLAFLIASWTVTYYILYRPISPHDDGLVHVTVSSFGSGEKADRLQEQVSLEIEKHLRLFDNVSYQHMAVRESVNSVTTAEKLARARGFHLIIYGKVASPNAKRNIVRATLLQVNPYKKIQLTRYDFERQADLSSLDELRTLAKDMALKVLRTCDQNYLLALKARHNQLRFNMSLGREQRTTFNVGSNITQRFLLGQKSNGQAFLEGSVSAQGEPYLSGRIFDSDGKFFFTIENSQPILSDPKAFSIQQRGRSFTVRDRYDRVLLEYKEEDKKSFIDRYVNAQSKEIERSTPVPLQDFSLRTRQTLSGFGRIITINGEIYREDGLLGLILSDEKLYQYAFQELRL